MIGSNTLWHVSEELLKPQFHHRETGSSWTEDEYDVWYSLAMQIHDFDREDPKLAAGFTKRIC